MATIQKITAETGTEIDVKDDGTVMIASPDGAAIQAAKDWIASIVEEPEVGKIYKDRPVVSVLDFGAFVQNPAWQRRSWCTSQKSLKSARKVSDKLKEGDKVTVKQWPLTTVAACSFP